MGFLHSSLFLTIRGERERERDMRKKMMMMREQKDVFCEEFRGEKVVD